MKEIELTQGKCAMVDDADYEWLSQWKWYAHRGYSGVWYAVRNTPHDVNGKQKTIKMHRFIMDAPDGIQIDHEDHDGLNNQRNNIRFATRSQNAMNSRPYGKSQFSGVSWHKIVKKWCAQIKINGIHKHLGYFANESDAAMAYDRAAIQYHGEFANPNFKLMAAASRLLYTKTTCHESN